MVITCEANRNAHTALLHIEETNHQETVPLELFQTINREIRKRTGVDHNIGIKMPVLMHKAGLVYVQARKSDECGVFSRPWIRITSAGCSRPFAMRATGRPGRVRNKKRCGKPTW